MTPETTLEADIAEIDLIDAKVVADLERCRSRIGTLGSLSDGWHDGSGKAPTQESIVSAHRLLARNPGLAPSYTIFPTDNGGLLFEFAKGDWDYAIEIGPDGQAEIYGVESDATAKSGLGYRKAEPDAVTLPLRWTKDGIGDALLWAGPLNVGYVHPLSGSSEGNWRADGCLAVFSGVYATKAEAMAAMQAAVLEALAE